MSPRTGSTALIFSSALIWRCAVIGPAFLFLAVLSGCLRYTPSRAELQDNESVERTEQAGQLGGPEQFRAHEELMRKRLADLVQERSGYAQGSQSGYILGTGDQLSLVVYGFSNLSTDLEVAPDGMVTFPMIGDVRGAGRDIVDFRGEVVARMARYIKSPRVRLAVKEFQASKVSVAGEVAKPGVYPLRHEGQLISELISEAGGRTQKAGNRIVLIPSGRSRSAGLFQTVSSGGTPAQQRGHGVEIDLDDITGTLDRPPLELPLLGGDTIIIPEAGTFEVDGEVNNPGSFPIAARTSVLSAIAAAGGLTYSAKAEEVEVIRDIGAGRKASLSLNVEDVALHGLADVRLRDGDLIRVPSDSGRFARRQIVEAINSIFRGVGVTRNAN